MRGVVYCYSGSGNTLLACDFIRRHLGIPVDVVDVIASPSAAVGDEDLVGFAASTDFFGVPRAFEVFIENIPTQASRPAFVFNTFGAVSGATLKDLGERVAGRGFEVLDGHSLRMPESYPRMIARGMSASGAPSARQTEAFGAFVARLGGVAEDLKSGREPKGRKLPVSLLNRALSSRPRTTARDDMGEKTVDAAACTECGTCRRNCPYGAITLAPKPVFDMATCFGCWRCYNRCPSRAIHVKGVGGKAFYSGPSDILRRKFE